MTDKNHKSELRFSRYNKAVLISIIVLCVAAVFSYFFLDEFVFSGPYRHFNNSQESNWLKTFKQLGKGWLVTWLLLFWVWAGGSRRAAVTGLLALLMVSATVYPLKVLVHRPRPQDVIKEHSRAEDKPTLTRSWSFPSGDTATAFAASTALAASVGWLWGLALFITSSGIGFLRLTVFAHYPSDIFGGAATGIFCGWLARQIGLQWAALEGLRANLVRSTAMAGVIVIPVSIGLLRGIDDTVIFLKTYGVLAAGVYLIVKGSLWLKRLQRQKDKQGTVV